MPGSGNGVGEKYALWLRSHGYCSLAVPFLPHSGVTLAAVGRGVDDGNVRAPSVLTLCRTLPPSCRARC